MPNELTTAMQRAISRAAQSTPAVTGEVETFRKRWERVNRDLTVVLADTSGSMDASAGAKRKIDHLRDALAEVWPQIAGGKLFRFDSVPVALSDPSQLTAPSGGTDLALALQAAAEHSPGRTLVITDGEPNDEAAALAAAEKLTGRIDAIYCGPDSNKRAIEFLRRLTRIGGGGLICTDLVKHATGRGVRIGCRKLLGLPSPD